MEEKDILQAALAKAITEAVSPEVRKEVFQKAMTNYLFRAADCNGSDKSVLTEAFRRALDNSTQDLAKAVVAEPENQKRIRDAIQAGFNAALDTKAFQEKITEKILHGITRGY